jgi:hypothetical protein
MSHNDSGHGGNCKLAVNCNYERRRVSAISRNDSSYGGNCKLTVNCDCKRVLA